MVRLCIRRETPGTHVVAKILRGSRNLAAQVRILPRELGAQITQKLRIPTIGIGAGPDCDGQVLVFHDFAGLTLGHMPKFARKYADLGGEISRAAKDFCDDVRAGRFPSDAESYHSPAELRELLLARERS